MRDHLAGSPNLFTTSFVRESFNALDTRPWWFLPSFNALLCQQRVARPLTTTPSLSPELWPGNQLGSAVTIKRLTIITHHHKSKSFTFPLSWSSLCWGKVWPCHHTSAISISIKFITPTAFFSWPHPSVWWWLGWSKLNPPPRLTRTIRLAREPPKHHEKCGHQNRQMKKIE